MAWFPWAEIPNRLNLRPDELIDWLRYRAIEFGAPPLFIHNLDELYAYSTQDERIEELEGALGTAEDERDAYKKFIEKIDSDEAREVLDGWDD